jgi:hypothetical protein
MKTAIQGNAIVAVVAICGGYFGAVVRDWIRTAPQIVRAKRFEVIGASGTRPEAGAEGMG